MKKLILSISFLLLFSFATNAQTVEVPQSFVDAANQAFKEVKLLREAVEAQKETIAAKNDAVDAKNATIKAQDDLIKIKDEQIEKLVKVTCTKSSFLIFVYRSKKCF